MKKIIVGIIAITLIVTSGLALAQGWGRGNGRGVGNGPGANGYYPNSPTAWSRSSQYQKNLTPEQQTQLKNFSGSYGPGYGTGGGFSPGRGAGRGFGMGYGTCPRW